MARHVCSRCMSATCTMVHDQPGWPCPACGPIQDRSEPERFPCRHGHDDCARNRGGQCADESWERRMSDAGTAR